MTVTTHNRPGFYRSEMPLWSGILTTILFTLYVLLWFAAISDHFWYNFLFVGLVLVILWQAFAVVRHACSLAVLLGEPRGTLI
jgi:Ca2+/H+ antiporter